MVGKIVPENILGYDVKGALSADVFHSIIGHKGVLTKTAASLAVVGAGVYLLERHQRRAAEVTINQYAEHPGSLEGLDRSSSALIQMDNTGYDDPQNQDARMGFKRMSAAPVSSVPALGNPVSNLVSRGIKTDLRKPMSSLDDRLSRML